MLFATTSVLSRATILFPLTARIKREIVATTARTTYSHTSGPPPYDQDLSVEFDDEGIVLSARAHGESHAVAEIFTRKHGRWAGLVYGGQGRRQQPVLQIGNGVVTHWKGRLDDSLGHHALELSQPRAAALLGDRLALAGLTAAAATTLACLPEREPHPRLYIAFMLLLDSLEDADIWPALFARYELGLLAELGFGLSLDRCVATGTTEDLIYVSPRSAAAVSREAGEPYRGKLLPLPAFLRDAAAPAEPQDMLDALTTTAAFIETRVLHPASRTLPEARADMIRLLTERARIPAP